MFLRSLSLHNDKALIPEVFQAGNAGLAHRNRDAQRMERVYELLTMLSSSAEGQSGVDRAGLRDEMPVASCSDLQFIPPPSRALAGRLVAQDGGARHNLGNPCSYVRKQDRGGASAWRLCAYPAQQDCPVFRRTSNQIEHS